MPEPSTHATQTDSFIRPEELSKVDMNDESAPPPRRPEVNITRRQVTSEHGPAVFRYEVDLTIPNTITNPSTGETTTVNAGHTLGTLHRVPPYWYPDSSLRDWMDRHGGPIDTAWKTKDQVLRTIQGLVDQEYPTLSDEVDRLLNY